VVQNACKSALIYLQLPSATSSPTLPVVSEWYQKATADESTLLSNERSFYTLTVPGVSGVASSLDCCLHWTLRMGTRSPASLPAIVLRRCRKR
jgi:hypothetical protein